MQHNPGNPQNASYIDAYKPTIEAALSDAVNACFKHTPSSPLAFIANHILARSGNTLDVQQAVTVLERDLQEARDARGAAEAEARELRRKLEEHQARAHSGASADEAWGPFAELLRSDSAKLADAAGGDKLGE